MNEFNSQGVRCIRSFCKGRQHCLVPHNCGMFDESKKTFEEAMKEVQVLRSTRAETLFKLFRLSLCQSAIQELKR